MTSEPKQQTYFVREITAQYSGPRLTAPVIREALDATRFLAKVVKDNAREHFFALYLDGAHRVASYSVVSTGSANKCQVHPREVFQPAILSGACAIIIAHNHPSGDAEPSSADREITRHLIECGKLLCIPVLDHIVFCEHGHVAFSERGWMTNPDLLIEKRLIEMAAGSRAAGGPSPHSEIAQEPLVPHGTQGLRPCQASPVTPRAMPTLRRHSSFLNGGSQRAIPLSSSSSRSRNLTLVCFPVGGTASGCARVNPDAVPPFRKAASDFHGETNL